MEMIKLHPQFLMDDQGRKTSVMLPVNEFYSLIEDLDDQLIIAQRKDDESVPLGKAMEELDLSAYV